MELRNRIKTKLSNESLDKTTPFPKKNLLIEVTNYCNNKCVFCYNDCMTRERKFIDKNICEKVLEEAYELGMREVGFYVVGEPLLDKRLEEFISFAKKQGYEYIYLTTNGILANLDRVKSLYNSGLNSIKFSINATNIEDYIMVHGTNKFNTVIKNLTDVYRWKIESNINLKVYVSYITLDITKNKFEINNLFKDRCDEYIVMPAINQGGLIPEINQISTKEQNDINGNFKLPCSYPFNSVIVTAEGYLTACCMDFENLLAYANLNNTSLEEAWNNFIISQFRRRHISKDVDGTICANCIYNTKDIPQPLDVDLCSLKEIDNGIFKKRLLKVGKR